jgi:serine/threonine-protein kinase
MASVWLARLSGKHGFEKLFAIKTILPQFAEDVRFQQMFLDEARVASRIEHANVAQVLDLGEEHGILYLVMQWVDGDSLSRVSRAASRQKVKLPIPIILRVLADTCSGLHAAHEVTGSEGQNLGVVHRDVSPQNILVTPEGVAKLIDFGVAKAHGRLSDETVAGQLKGKIHYMARPTFLSP